VYVRLKLEVARKTRFMLVKKIICKATQLPPKLINARKVYAVPEINNYKM